jgi:hypothetical protein
MTHNITHAPAHRRARAHTHNAVSRCPHTRTCTHTHAALARVRLLMHAANAQLSLASLRDTPWNHGGDPMAGCHGRTPTHLRARTYTRACTHTSDPWCSLAAWLVDRDGGERGGGADVRTPRGIRDHRLAYSYNVHPSLTGYNVDLACNVTQVFEIITQAYAKAWLDRRPSIRRANALVPRVCFAPVLRAAFSSARPTPRTFLLERTEAIFGRHHDYTR